jgi:GH15 family glucan-1,4-alpha-glucosidase
VALRIEDYALLGDTGTAALVGRDGSIDWLCLPRFDSGACFAALLGDAGNGRWQLAPASEVKATRRRYRDGTLVLETEMDVDDGTVRIIDFMPVRGEAPDVVRIVEGVRGQVPMHMQLVMRFDYGWIVPWVRRIDGGLAAVAGPDALVLRTPVPTRGADMTTVADFTVSAGERVPFVLTWHPSYRQVPTPIDAEVALADTDACWREWSVR